MKLMKTFNMAIDLCALLYEAFPTVTKSDGLSSTGTFRGELKMVKTVTKATFSPPLAMEEEVEKWVLLRDLMPGTYISKKNT